MNHPKYYYSLNGVFHEIDDTRVKIRENDQSLLSTYGAKMEKIFLSQKYMLKYLHDLFSIHHIDYSIYHNTLLGYHLFQGVHIFQPSWFLSFVPNVKEEQKSAATWAGSRHPSYVELIMMYRNFEDLYQELKSDGFHIDFESKYVMVISTSFFDQIQIKAFIYFLHPHEDGQLYNIHPKFVNESKRYKDLLQKKESYHLLFSSFYVLFPFQLVKYEDFEVYAPANIDEILDTFQLKMDSYSYSIEPNEDKEEETTSNSASLLSNVFSTLLARSFGTNDREQSSRESSTLFK